MPAALTDPQTRFARHAALLDDSEADLYDAITRAQHTYLSEARAALNLTAAADRRRFGPLDPTRLLERLPSRERWAALLREHVWPAIKRWFRRAFTATRDEFGDLDLAIRWVLEPVEGEYGDQFAHDAFPGQVADEVQYEVLDSDGHHDGLDLIRDRIARVLSPTAPVRWLRDAWAARRRAGRSEPDREPGDADLTWRNYARHRARWYAVGAHNRATLDSARQIQQATGEPLFKGWESTPDERVRPTHWRSHKQSVPLEAFFRVGAALLRYPGDPLGPPEEIANCRCVLVPNDLHEHDRSNEERRMELEYRFTPDGKPLVAAVTSTDSDGEVPSGYFRAQLAPLEKQGDYRVLGTPPGSQVRCRNQMWLLFQPSNKPAHEDAIPVGRIDRAWIEGSSLMGEGVLDMEDPTARDVHRKLAKRFAGTVSVDLDVQPEDVEERHFDTDGNHVADFASHPDPDSLKKLTYVKDWRLGGATLVPHPAFHEANVSLEAPKPEGAKPAAVTAADRGDRTAWAERVAAVARDRLEPDPSCFADPQLTAPTKVTVADDGTVFGHVACWDTSHISFPGDEVHPPRSETSYAMFHRHPVRCSDGSRIRTGVLVMGTSHADLTMSTSAASSHYDHSGHIVADVRCGEDRHGIWCAGSLHPEVTPLQISVLDRYSLSGDWRNGELVAALCVNTPGFPIPDSLAASGELPLTSPTPQQRTGQTGEQYALVAAGMVTPDPVLTTAELAAEVRSLREELVTALAAQPALDGVQVYRQARAAEEQDRIVRAAFDRIHGERISRLREFATTSGGDGRPKRRTDGEDASSAATGKSKKKPKPDEAPDPKELGEQDKADKEAQAAEQGLLEDPEADAEEAEQDGSLLDDGDTGPAQEDWDVLATLDSLDEEDVALIEAMTGEPLANPETGDDPDDPGFDVDEEGTPSPSSGEEGAGKLKPRSEAPAPEEEDPEAETGEDAEPEPKEPGKSKGKKTPPKFAARPSIAVAMTAAKRPNWVDEHGGLPPYIKRISRHLKKKGMSESHSIATAVNVVKKMCGGGDKLNWPGAQKNVRKGSVAQACAAVAKWESMKAKAKGGSGGSAKSKSKSSDTSKKAA